MNDPTELQIYGDFRYDVRNHEMASLRAESQWDNQRLELRPRKSSDLENLLGVYGENKRPTDIDVSNCTWNDVLQQMQDARRMYEEKGRKNAIRGFFRHGESIKMVLNPLLEVIPEDHGLRCIKGGLALLFNSLAKRQGNVDKVLACFEDIPLVMEKAQDTHQIFLGDTKLGDYMWALYDALLTGIPHLIRIILRKSDETWWKRFIHSIPTEQERLITDIILRVDRAKSNLMEYAETIGYRTTASIDKTTTRTLEGVTAIRLNIHEMSSDVRQGFTAVMKSLLYLEKRIDELSEEKARLDSRIVSAHQPNNYIYVIQTAVYHLGQEAIYQRNLLPAPRPRTPIPYRSSCPPSFKLLQLLGSGNPTSQDHLQASLDLEEILRKRYSFDDESIGRSRWLLTTSRFRDWLTVPEPRALAVHSYGQGGSEGRTSAMSVLCATLTSALFRPNANVVLLHFFCGLHADEDDGFAGPIGLMRSLAMQTILARGVPEPDLEFANGRDLNQDLCAGNPAAFAHVFSQLIGQLPPGTTVYCLIDGADIFDTRRNGWNDALHTILRLLGQLVYDRSSMLIFKLLVTTPYRSDIILDELRPPSASEHLDPAINLLAGEVDRRPFTEDAIIADVKRLDVPLVPIFARQPDFMGRGGEQLGCIPPM